MVHTKGAHKFKQPREIKPESGIDDHLNPMQHMNYLSSNRGDRGGVLGVTKEGLNTLAWSRILLFIPLLCILGEGDPSHNNLRIKVEKY